MSQEDHCRAIIIDSGGDTIKGGFAKDQWPSVMFPCLLWRPAHVGVMVGRGKYVYVGDEAKNKMGILYLRTPIENGMITNWDDMEDIWHHLFYDGLRIAPEENPILLTETPLTPKANREKSTQIMFETFNAPALYISVSAVLSLYGSGRVTGVVLESGHTVSHTVPIHSGYALPHAIQRLDLAGSHLTHFLAERLTKCGYSLKPSANSLALTDTARDIKEKLAYVPLCYDHPTQENEAAAARHYQLPDGQTVCVDRELLQCPMSLFQASCLHVRGEGGTGPPPASSPDGIHQLLNASILECDIDIRKHLYSNVVLSGGSTLFPGMRERVEKELASLSPPTASVRVLAPAGRRNLAWIGGANLASLRAFDRMWVCKQEYDECGCASRNTMSVGLTIYGRKQYFRWNHQISTQREQIIIVVYHLDRIKSCC